MFGDASIDPGLEVDHGVEAAALEAAADERGEEGLDRVLFSREPGVGVKWKAQRGCRASQRITLGCLCPP